MPKITLDDLGTLQNEQSVIGTINTNNSRIEQALEKTLSRDGTTPNEMEANFDLNGFKVINSGAPVDDNDLVRLIDVETIANNIAQGPEGPEGPQGPQGPTGSTGPAGPANSLSIGTVTTGSAGSSASATITGTSPTQTLNLIIPRGDAGAGSGDVTAAANFATDNRVIRSDGTGKGVQVSDVVVDDDGKVGINNATPQSLLHVGSAYGGSVPAAAIKSGVGGRHAVVSGNKVLYFDIIGNTYGEISTFDYGLGDAFRLSFNANGGATAFGLTTVTTGFVAEFNGSVRCTSLTQTSDETRKIKTGDAPGMAWLRKIRAGCMMFKWKHVDPILDAANRVVRPGQEAGSRTHCGVSAQAVKKASDEMGFDFGGYKDTAFSDHEHPSEKALDYSQLIAPIIVGLCEQDDALQLALKKIEALEAEVAILKAQ